MLGGGTLGRLVTVSSSSLSAGSPILANLVHAHARRKVRTYTQSPLARQKACIMHADAKFCACARAHTHTHTRTHTHTHAHTHTRTHTRTHTNPHARTHARTHTRARARARARAHAHHTAHCGMLPTLLVYAQKVLIQSCMHVILQRMNVTRPSRERGRGLRATSGQMPERFRDR